MKLKRLPKNSGAFLLYFIDQQCTTPTAMVNIEMNSRPSYSLVCTFKCCGFLHRFLTHTTLHLLNGLIFPFFHPCFYLAQNPTDCLLAVMQQTGCHHRDFCT